MKIIFILAFVLVATTSSAQLNKAYFYYQSQRLISQSRYTEAIRYLNTLIEVDSTIAEGWFLRGAAKYYLDDLHGALKDFSNSIRINPLFTQSYLYRAIVENQLSRHSDALKDLEQALELRPDDQEALFTRGATYIQTLQYNLAIEDYNKVIRYSPNNLGAWINRGIAKLYANDTLGALDDYNQAIKLNPFNSDSYSRRGRVYSEQKEYNLALSDINQAIFLDSMATINYFIRGMIFNAMNNYQSAIEDFNKVIKIDPKNSLALYNRALIKSNTGALNSALDDYNALIKLNPNNVLVFYNRASVNYELGKFTEAINDYTSAINLFPDFANAYINRSFAKSRIGNIKGAEEDYRIANQKIQKYKTSKQDAYLAMADTSKKFNTLLSFDADFTEGYSRINLLNDITLPTGFQPLYKLQLIAETSKTIFRHFDNAFIDSLNSKSPKGYRFAIYQTTKSTIQYTQPEIKQSFNNCSQNIKLFFNALEYSSMNKYNQAVQEYNKLLQNDTDNQIVNLNLAVEKTEMTKFIEQFTNDMNSVSFEMGGNSNNKVDQSKSIAVNYDDIIDQLHGIEIKLPDLAIVPYNTGTVYLYSEKLDNAIQEFNKALKLEPNFAEAWFNRGMVYLAKGDKTKGCYDISKSGELGINQAYSIIQKFCK